MAEKEGRNRGILDRPLELQLTVSDIQRHMDGQDSSELWRRQSRTRRGPGYSPQVMFLEMGSFEVSNASGSPWFKKIK